jgi:tRNA dimethylallyltransferase
MLIETKKGYAFFLTGPTATGKTAVAHFIAEQLGLEILSSDAMLVYKGMDIGTAKPDKAMQQKVRYWGFDLAEASEQYNVAKYVSYVQSIMNKAKHPLIVVGGSGLYIKALLNGLDNMDDFSHQESARKHAEKLLADGGVAALQKELFETSPELFRMVKDKSNPRRLIRALEMASAPDTKVDRTWRKENEPIITALVMERAELKARIARRAEQFFHSGIIEEAGALLAVFEKSPSNTNLTALQAIGYKEAIDFIQGKTTLEEAINKTVVRTFHLAKKQITWFKHQANVEWINVQANDTIEETAKKVMDSWQRNGAVELAV